MSKPTEHLRRATTDEEKQYWTFTIIVDEDVATYIDQTEIIDANGYMNQLLREEQARQAAKGMGPGFFGEAQNLDDLLRNTPDTSGYPEMKGHFHSGGNLL